MSSDVLGVALREVRGLLGELNDSLSGEQAAGWLVALRKFLRKENPWGTEGIPLYCISNCKGLQIQLVGYKLPFVPSPGLTIDFDTSGDELQMVVKEVIYNTRPTRFPDVPPLHIVVIFKDPHDSFFDDCIKVGWCTV